MEDEIRKLISNYKELHIRTYNDRKAGRGYKKALASIIVDLEELLQRWENV
jgi:hypothetical protein